MNVSFQHLLQPGAKLNLYSEKAFDIMEVVCLYGDRRYCMKPDRFPGKFKLDIPIYCAVRCVDMEKSKAVFKRIVFSMKLDFEADYTEYDLSYGSMYSDMMDSLNQINDDGCYPVVDVDFRLAIKNCFDYQYEMLAFSLGDLSDLMKAHIRNNGYRIDKDKAVFDIPTLHGLKKVCLLDVEALEVLVRMKYCQLSSSKLNDAVEARFDGLIGSPPTDLIMIDIASKLQVEYANLLESAIKSDDLFFRKWREMTNGDAHNKWSNEIRISERTEPRALMIYEAYLKVKPFVKRFVDSFFKESNISDEEFMSEICETLDYIAIFDGDFSKVLAQLNK